MSHGFSSMKRWILEDLGLHTSPQSTEALLDSYMLEQEPERSRHSIRRSLTRALGGLKAAGKIEFKDKKWQLVGAWPARDAKERQRIETAYHEAGHAVVGLAGQLSIALVTIRPSGNVLGYVSRLHGPRAIGHVVKNYRIIERVQTDAFGNPACEREIADGQRHAQIRCDIAGGMAEAHFAGDYAKWRQRASSADMSKARWCRRQLGDRAKTWTQYEAETYALVREYWDMIEAVAARLLQEETICGADVDDICVRIARRNIRRKHSGDTRCSLKISVEAMAA